MAELSSVEAFAPASMGNVGVGFDILGLAYREPGDVVRAEFSDGTGVQIAGITGDGGVLPLDPAKNTASVAAQALLDEIGAERGIRLWIEKGLPLASGLGSSAASAVAAVFAVNTLLGKPLSREALLPACLAGEALVSGYHADNAGPSLLGGITLITGTKISEIRRLPVPDNLHFALMTPAVAVPTASARAALPKMISLHEMVHQTGAVAALIDALYRNDLESVAVMMESDHVVEPARANLMPLLVDARLVAKRAGAMSLVISGAGPTLCAVCDDALVAGRVAEAMQALYDEARIGGDSRVTCVDQVGARVVRAE